MVIDLLKNAALYWGMHPRMGEAFRYLQKTDFSRIEAGRYEIDGANLFVLIQNYDPKPQANARWEAHRKYVDVQYVHSGCELFGYAPLERLNSVAYDEAKDFHELKGEGDFLRAPAGTFLILFPQDAHMPGIAGPGSQPVKKIVVKVLLGKE
jgi:YhcH/YjgK/YiaL family protein